MTLEPLLILEMALLGVCTGFLAGLLGIGGGMLMVPFITLILTSQGYPPEYTVKMAVATSLATDRKSTRLNSSHIQKSRMPSSA